jgi:S-DNA-T family DNA segregation ATPase FtsK/SpoIIIE
MATSARKAAPGRMAQLRGGLGRGARRSGEILAGLTLVAASLLLLLSLVSYRPSDPSLNTSAGGPVNNWMGTSGAFTSDLLMSLMGPPVGLLVPVLLLLGLRMARGADAGRWLRAILLAVLGIVLIGTATALLIGGAVNGLPAGWGGAFGLSLASLVELGISQIGEPGISEPFRVVVVALAGLAGVVLWWLGLGLRPEERSWIFTRRTRSPRLPMKTRWRSLRTARHEAR